MPRRITIQPHLSLEELETRYRQTKDAVERTYYQIIWLVAQGKQTSEVAAITGYSRGWLYELVWGYNSFGPETLGDQCHHNPGGKEPLLDDVQQALLWQALQEPASDGRQWNGRKVADWIAELIGRPVGRQRGWEYFKQMRLRLRVPRPIHEEAAPKEQAEWKKNLATQVEKIRQAHPDCDVELWAMDEHRAGLTAIFR